MCAWLSCDARGAVRRTTRNRRILRSGMRNSALGHVRRYIPALVRLLRAISANKRCIVQEEACAVRIARNISARSAVRHSGGTAYSSAISMGISVMDARHTGASLHAQEGSESASCAVPQTYVFSLCITRTEYGAITPLRILRGFVAIVISWSIIMGKVRIKVYLPHRFCKSGSRLCP